MTNQTDVEVIIIGAGPVGLATALQLGRAGVKTFVAERRPTQSRHPKAAGIHARTMEIYRQWGLSEPIRTASGWAHDAPFTVEWRTRLNGMSLGAITVGDDPSDRDLFHSWSPESHCFCGQNAYEPVLADRLKDYGSVELRLGVEATGVSQDASGVSAQFLDRDSGETFEVRGKYLLGADGVRSPVRGWAGLTEGAEPAFGDSINVSFKADLEAFRGVNHLLYWTINKDTQGAFVYWRNGEWTYNFEAKPGEDPAIYTPERSATVVRQAIGEDLPLEIVSILHWRHDQAVSPRWRSGRILLAGDAAHRFPPHGGFGMNSGVQDSLNLAWKLIGVLRWGAGDRLLDTYEAERGPVAQVNAEQCILNTRRMEETGWLLADPTVLATIETPEGEGLRAAFAEAIPAQREQFFSHGQQFGYVYESAAMVADGSKPLVSGVREYLPNASPGARAPHLWLKRDGAEISSLDLYDTDFILFTGGAGAAWVEAAQSLASAGEPLSAQMIGGDGLQEVTPGDWTKLYGVDASGAVLIRPDGHVGARFAAGVEDPRAALKAALDAILAR